MADIEIVNTVQTIFIDSTDTILDMNVLNNHYKSMLKENDCHNHALLENKEKKSIESLRHLFS